MTCNCIEYHVKHRWKCLHSTIIVHFRSFLVFSASVQSTSDVCFRSLSEPKVGVAISRDDINFPVNTFEGLSAQRRSLERILPSTATRMSTSEAVCNILDRMSTQNSGGTKSASSRACARNLTVLTLIQRSEEVFEPSAFC